MASSEPSGSRSLSSPQQLITYLFYQTHRDNHLAGIEYRQQMLELWGISTGSSILEIGCGQGEFTVCLADAVGPTGRVVAVDPATPGWGMAPGCSTLLYPKKYMLMSRITCNRDALRHPISATPLG